VRAKRRGPDERERHADVARPAADGQGGAAARAASIAALQSSAGNRAVVAMMAARAPAAAPPRPQGTTQVERRSFSTTLRYADSGMAPPPAPVLAGASPDGKYDAHPTTPEEIRIPEAAVATPGPAPAGAAAESAAAAPAEGTVISLPDVIQPELANVQVCDAMTGALPYSAVIANTATPGPTQFGICNFGDVRVTGLTVTYDKATYKVAGTLENRITWGVHPTTDNETDIPTSTDAAITKTNYPKVADDLTPNMSSSGGRPPRAKFWAKDLTEIHEKFHADDVKGQGPAAATAAVAWLGLQTASTVIGVSAVVSQLPARVVQTLIAGMGEPAEVRAYGGGAAAYTARAADIRKRGAAGEYK
jgi:hypothetical protein